MKSLYFLSLNILLLFHLSSCTGGDKAGVDKGYEIIGKINRAYKLDDTQKKIVDKKCVVDRFAPNAEKDLYARGCIEGKSLYIQTEKDGEPIAISNALSLDTEKKADGLRTEGDPDVVTEEYNVKYKILAGEGLDKKFPFLKEDFLTALKESSEEKFYGSKNAKYRVIFKTKGNYLILYKASKKLEDIPIRERSALTRVKGEYVKENGNYLVPYLGYQIRYCRAKAELDSTTQEKLYIHTPNCHGEYVDYDPEKQEESERLKDEKEGLRTTVYLQIVNRSRREVYKYKDKKDFFPSDYFLAGEWFYSEGAVETFASAGHLSPKSAYLISFDPQGDRLDLKDISGKLKEKRNENFVSRFGIPVSWKEYEMDIGSGSVFNSFGEREKKQTGDPTKSTYLMIDFQKVKNTSNGEVIDFLVTPDYFSYVVSVPINICRLRANGSCVVGQDGKPVIVAKRKVKQKYSFLRKSTIKEEGFKQRKWFRKDYKHFFGIFPTEAQKVKQLGDTRSDFLDHIRMTRFHTDKPKTVIKWYISKNSTKDPFYLNIAREAVRIYDQAFQNLIKGTGKSMRVILDETEKKDLGDPRYNILNLSYLEEFHNTNYIFFGLAPSYVNPNTGQIIGATANIIIHNLLEQSFLKVKNYTRYEIFQKSKKPEEENKTHVISPYLRARIERQCPGLLESIRLQQVAYEKGKISPETELDDKKEMKSCAKSIFRINLLSIILHEMGHNFGLSHNFKGSVDEANFYQSVEEIKEYFPNLSSWLVEDLDFLKEVSEQEGKPVQKKGPFRMSTVMEYMPVMHAFVLPVLGKYDLAALGYLYLGKLEDREGNFIDLKIPENPDDQIPVSKMALFKEGKPYLHCPDRMLSERMKSVKNFSCVRRDYGAIPLEAVEHLIQKFKRSFNMGRYRYDNTFFQSLGFEYIRETIKYLNRWDKLKQTHFQLRKIENYLRYDLLKANEALKDYREKLTENVSKASEYSSYLDIREKLFDVYMDFLFMESMKCEVRDKQSEEYVIDLELIKKLFPKYLHYVEDCYSKSVQEVLISQGLELIRQKGVENLEGASYHSKESKKTREEGDNIFSLSEIQETMNKATFYRDLRTGQPGIMNSIKNSLVEVFSREPDFLEKMRKKLESRILSGENLSETDFDFTFSLYTTFKNSAMNEYNEARSYQELVTSNERYFQIVSFKRGTGEGSFYKAVTDPMSRGRNVEDLDLPFLFQAYKRYQKKDVATKESFEDYVMKLPDALVYGDKRFIPLELNGIMVRVIKKYNENQKRIEDLDKKPAKSFLENVELKNKQRYNKFLMKLVENSIRS